MSSCVMSLRYVKGGIMTGPGGWGVAGRLIPSPHNYPVISCIRMLYTLTTLQISVLRTRRLYNLAVMTPAPDRAKLLFHTGTYHEKL